MRSIIASLASVAATSNPLSARPTASSPVPAAQSSTRAPGASAPIGSENAATLPSGVSISSGTSHS